MKPKPSTNRFFQTLLLTTGVCVSLLSFTSCSKVATKVAGEDDESLTETASVVAATPPRQAPAEIFHNVLSKTNSGNSWVKISLSGQRAYLMKGNEIAINSPISTGSPGRSTPTGTFNVLERDVDHRSNLYGSYVSVSSGSTVRGDVGVRTHKRPSGTRFVGAPMFYFMRLTWGGIGMHIGYLPGYPASHGCIRVPAEIQPLIYNRTKMGTKVVVQH